MVRRSRSQKFILVARKDWLRHVACSRVESTGEREERLRRRRRREHYRIRRERETNEEREARFVKYKSTTAVLPLKILQVDKSLSPQPRAHTLGQAHVTYYSNSYYCACYVYSCYVDQARMLLTSV